MFNQYLTADEVVWRAFELRPEPVPALDPNGEYLRRVWRSSVYPLAEWLGVTMRPPPVQPRSRIRARSLGGSTSTTRPSSAPSSTGARTSARRACC
ncbi:MAG: hypothetical protein M3416_05715 [Acidobacteriota bacterium]|nr:hypothetical protein [Acidobacteriota bacterium]